ncbi:MAG: hypothetical protein ACJ79N_02850, partial [Gemmatimonadaceae bacterium]
MTVFAEHVLGVAADALASPISIGDEQYHAQQQEDNQNDGREYAQPPPTVRTLRRWRGGGPSY